MPKYRTNKIKHEHTIIPGLREALEEMAACPAIHALIPGPIRPHHTPRGMQVTLQYETEAGWKLLGRNGSAIQEVYVVTDDREEVRRWLLARGLLTERHPAEAQIPEANADPRPPGRAVVLQFEQRCAACGRAIRPGSRAIRRGGPTEAAYLHVRCGRGAPPGGSRPAGGR